MEDIKLLIVDDKLEEFEVIKDTLEITGDYTIMTAENGVAGLEAYRQFKPDIIVTDKDMPKMNGVEMVKKIRETDDKIPVIMLTGMEDLKSLGLSFKAGVNNFLSKPISAAKLDWYIKGMVNIVESNNPTHGAGSKNPDVFQIGLYTFDYKNNLLTFGAETQSLTTFENQLLKMLCDSKGNVVKRVDILQTIWLDTDDYKARSLDVYVSKLRDYLKQDTSIEIVTVKGVGLKLVG
ncbi:MAG: response regulator transcription factor [Tannerella sp.]|jgi:DNA-binding response OmpR family regulator|nr:response regulator transcription factor [Tannerella sp.]